MNQFQINTTTSWGQAGAAVSMDVDGDFVVVWSALTASGSTLNNDLLGQRYNAAGIRLGIDFEINVNTANNQTAPKVSVADGGGFVVVWQSSGQDGSGEGIYGRRYSADGTPQGGEFRVNTEIHDHQQNPSVSLDADGDFVVVWQSSGQDGSGDGIYGQRYNADGLPQGGEFRVNTTTVNDQRFPRVSSAADGSFVVVWQNNSSFGSADGIYGQRYNSAGMAQGGEFQINTTQTSLQNQTQFPDIALDNSGNFVVVWQSSSQSGSGTDWNIDGRIYNASGLPMGEEIRINAIATNWQREPSVSLDANGNFVVVWRSYNAFGFSYVWDGTNWVTYPPTTAVYGQRFNLFGAPQGGEFKINTDVNSTSTQPASVSLDASGDFIVVWAAEGQDGSSSSILGRRYNASGVAQGPAFMGTTGDDTLPGGTGANTMVGWLGHDNYIIDDPGDIIVEAANEGLDTAWVASNGWTMSANVEILRLYGAGTQVTGSTGDDIMVANAGAPSAINAGEGNDELWGGALAHTLNGGAGDDIIRGQDGAVSMIGGAGNDQFVVGQINASILELPNEGIDTAWLAVNNWTNFANVEIVRMAAPGVVRLTGADTAEDLVANQAEASRIDARGGHDVLWGSGFADTLNGEAGDDIMRGQGGADVMAGGEGNDQYVVFSSAATVTEGLNAGYDIVYFAGAGTFSIGDNVEEARLVADGIGLVGNAFANLLVGNNAGLASMVDGAGGADTVWGTAAGDTLIGGAGDDVIYSQGGADRILYNATGWGVDQVAGFAPSQAKIQFAAGSGVTQFSQLFLNSAGGNTQVEFNGNAILVFGMASMGASDFIFG